MAPYVEVVDSTNLRALYNENGMKSVLDKLPYYSTAKYNNELTNKAYLLAVRRVKICGPTGVCDPICA